MMTNKIQFRIWIPAIVIVLVLIAVFGYRLAGRDPGPPAIANGLSVPVNVTSEAASPASPVEFPERISAAEAGDFPELMRAILESTNQVERLQFISRLMQRWLAEDLESFAMFLDEAELEGLDLWDQIAPGIVEALRTVGDRMPDRDLQERIVERVLLRVAEVDPGSALVWAREFLTGDGLDTVLAGIAPEMVGADPEAAIALLDEVQSFPRQMEAAAGIGRALGRSDYPLAMTWAESFFSETERAFALSGVLHGMASRDFGRASAEYSRVVGKMKNRYREQVLADRAISGNTVNEEYEGLSPEEIEKADLAKPNPNLVYLENAARAIALELARRDPQEALDWAHSMDIYQGRAAAMETIYEEWSAADPQTAYRALMTDAGRRPEAVGKLFGTWAMSDAASASASALALKPGIERDSAIEGVARGWINSGGNPVQIAAWADRLQAASEIDRVSAIVASEAAFDNPVLALRQVQRISNPLKRSELFQEVFPNLVEENPNLARNALATVKLSPVEIEYFQNMLGP